jgi:hypothetical protein
VIAPKDERKSPLLEGGERRPVQLLADSCDFADVLLGWIAECLYFRNRRNDITFVYDRHAQSGEALAEPGDPKRGRPHVDAAAIPAEIE